MCTRCTPYGLFASCTTGNFLDTTNIELSDKNSVATISDGWIWIMFVSCIHIY